MIRRLRQRLSGIAVALALAPAFVLAALPAQAARDHLTLGITLEPPHLDPTATAAETPKEVTYANIFEGLTCIDRHGRVQPALAEGWTVSEDGRTYTFQLRRGVVFHDSAAFDSGAVAFTLRRAMAPDTENGHRNLFEPIAEVSTPDAFTVVITLKRPTSHFLFNLGQGDAVIVHPQSAAGNKVHPIGTGPFRFRQWLRGDRVELERFSRYWGRPAPLRTVTFRFIANPLEAISEMAVGSIQAFPNMPARDALGKFQGRANYRVRLGTTEGETILAINHARPPFDDLRVRRALAHAVDRRALTDDPHTAMGIPIGSHFPPHHPAHVDLTGRYAHDPAEARRLLAEAGHPNGFKAVLKLPPPSYARLAGMVIASQLAEVGIELDIQRVDWKTWLDEVFKRKDYDLTIIAHTEPMDLEIYARDDYYFNYRSPEMRALMRRIDETLDEDRRNALLGDAQRLIAEDCVNVFLFLLVRAGVWDARLDGFWENHPILVNDLTEVRWTE